MKIARSLLRIVIICVIGLAVLAAPVLASGKVGSVLTEPSGAAVRQIEAHGSVRRPKNHRALDSVSAGPPSAADSGARVWGAMVLAGDRSAATGERDAYASRIARARGRGLFAFIRLSAAAGFLALLTPCVFPMIPITVSFFTKRKGGTKGRGVGAAAAYCVGIVATFTGLGLLVTLLFGASGIARFATNPYVNIGLAILFILLAANLLGAFEVVLPSNLVNTVNAKSRGDGLWKPLLMGLAFTLTSFTCTAPFVGTLLVTATRGATFYPLVGMLAFSAAFALPFFFLALFPQALARLPKSGSWLISVKAVMGLLELAAALKFLSNADLVWQFGLLPRPVFLGLWAIIAAISALYLLGWIRLPNDLDPGQIGWTRRLLGLGSAAAVAYLLAGLAGRSLGELDSFVPPSPYPGRGAAAVASAKGPTSGAEWLSDYGQALAQAKAAHLPILVNFTGVTCTNCRWMEQNMFVKPEIAEELNRYVKVELYTDRETPGDDKNKDLEEKLTGVVTLPVYVALTPDGKVRKQFQGLTRDSQTFLTFLRQGRSSDLTTAMR